MCLDTAMWSYPLKITRQNGQEPVSEASKFKLEVMLEFRLASLHPIVDIPGYNHLCRGHDICP